MKEPIQVSILNQTFPVHTDASSEHVQQVAKLINKKVNEIQKHSKKASSLHVALLTCLNIADEYLQLQNTKKELQSLAENKVSELIEIVDLQL